MGEWILKRSCSFKTVEDDRGRLIAFDNFQSFSLKRFYVIDCNKGKWRGDHYHKVSTQLIGVIQGELEIEISGNCNNQAFSMKPGDMFEQAPGVRFKFRSVQETSRLIVLCDSSHDLGDYYT